MSLLRVLYNVTTAAGPAPALLKLDAPVRFWPVVPSFPSMVKWRSSDASNVRLRVRILLEGPRFYKPVEFWVAREAFTLERRVRFPFGLPNNGTFA